MAGMIVLLLVIDTCMTVAFAFRLSSTNRHVKRLELHGLYRKSDSARNENDGEE